MIAAVFWDWALLQPPVYGAVHLSRELLRSGALEWGRFWFALLCGFDVIALVLGWVLFEHVVRD